MVNDHIIAGENQFDMPEEPLPKKTTSPTEAEEFGGNEVSLSDIFGGLKRHLLFISLCGLICMVLAGLYTSLKRPVYEASATIRIDPGRASSLGVIDQVGTPVIDESEIIQTEIGILKSDAVVIRALNTLNSDQYQRLTGEPVSSRPEGATTAILTPRQEGVVQAIELQTTAKPITGTQLVKISYLHRDPKLAAAMVNNIVVAYQAQSLFSRDASVSLLRTALTAQMDSLKSQVQSSQEKLANFQEANSILATVGSSNTVNDGLKALNDRLGAAEADRVTKESQLRAAENASPTALAALFPNPKLNELQNQQVILEAKYAQLSSKFAAKYPPLLELQKQIQVLDAEVSTNIQAVRSRLRQEYDAARDVKDTFQREYDKQIAAAYAVNRNQAEYAVLLAEVTSGRDLYDALRRKLQQAVVDAEVSGVNVMVVDGARPPTRPVGPGHSIVMASSLLIGLFAGATSAFLFDSTSDRFQRPQQIQNITRFPLLVSICEGGRRRGKDVQALFPTLQDSSSEIAERYRCLRTFLLLASRESQAIILAVVSAEPLEKAAETAANTAICLAQSGLRTLLVDADFSMPSLHTLFSKEISAGLSELLLGTEGQSYETPLPELPNLLLLQAGVKTSQGSDALASEAFRVLLQTWKFEFDYVVLQAGSVLQASNSLLMAKRSDAVFLVASYKSTSISSLKQTRIAFAQVGASVSGVVMYGGSEKAGR